MSLILLLGNDGESLRALEEILTGHGYDTQVLVSVERVVENLDNRPDAVVFDLTRGLPQEVVGHFLRENELHGRVATLAALSLEQAVSVYPSLWLDDFFIWPGWAPEVQARVRRALWQHTGLNPAHVIRVGDLTIDTANYKVFLAGQPVELRYKEYELLRFLAMNPNKVLTRQTLLNAVWGYNFYGGARTVDTHIRRLRSRIEDSRHTFIETVRNVGYRFRSG